MMATRMSPQNFKVARTVQRLHKVSDVRRRELAIDVELREAVAAARRDGASWSAIGDALGVAMQSAWKKFS